jgi:hypothetical protein
MIREGMEEVSRFWKLNNRSDCKCHNNHNFSLNKLKKNEEF